MDIEYHIQKGNKEFLLMKVYSIANRWAKILELKSIRITNIAEY